MGILKKLIGLPFKILGMLLLTLALSLFIKSIIGYAVAPPGANGVLMLNSEPAPSGVEVTLIPQGGGTNISGYTDSRGRFSIGNVVESQNYSVEVSASLISEYTGFPETFDIVSANPYVAIVGNSGYTFSNLSFTSGGNSINATVLDSDNVPVESSLVTATTSGDSQIDTDDGSEAFNVQPGSIIDQETTDSNGNAVLNVFPGDTYTICATAVAGGEYCNQNVSSDMDTTISFPALYTASGTVTFNNLPAPSNTEIVLTSSDGLYSANTYVNNSGDFTIGGLAIDNYYIQIINNSSNTVSLPQSFNMTSTSPYINIDNSNVSVPIVDFTSSALNISVINLNGEPIVDTSVTASDTTQGMVPTSDGTQTFITQPGSTSSQGLTDNSGAVTLSVLQGETYSACATNNDISQTFCTPDVNSGSSGIINYSSDYSVSGSLSLGSQPSGISLELYQVGAAYPQGQGGVTDNTGSYSIDDVTNGSYLLGINYSPYWPYGQPTFNYGPSLVSNTPYISVDGSNTTLNTSINTETLTVNFVDGYGNPVYTGVNLDITQTSNNPIYTSDGLESFSGSEQGYEYSNPGSDSLTLDVFPNQTYTICQLGRTHPYSCLSGVSSDSGEVEYDVDGEPTITYSLSSSPNPSGLYNTPITVTFNCYASVIESCTAPVTLTTAGDNQVVTGTVTDYNGQSASTSVSLNVEQDPLTLGTPTWTTNPVIVGNSTSLSIAATDSLSSVLDGNYYIDYYEPGITRGTEMEWNGSEFTANMSFLEPGTYQIYIIAEDAAGNWSAVTTTSIVVDPPLVAPTITSPMIDHIDARVPINFTVTTTGTPIPSLSETGTLPPGITFVDNGDGTATISGQASTTNTGWYFVTITATSSAGTATQNFVMTVDNLVMAPTIISGNSYTATYGTPFSFTVDTTGDPIPNITKLVGSGSFPGGVSLTDNNDGTATISGTPSGSANGVYTFTLKAKNNQGTATQVFTLTVNRAPTLANISTQTATVGTAFSQTVTANYGYPIPSFTVSGLPSGLSLTDNGNGTATISGTPAVGDGGTYTVTINATNSFGTATETYILKVNEAPTITSVNNATATVGSAFSFQVTSTGYPAPNYSYTGTLPSGVTFHNGTGILSGTPRTGTAGTYTITVTASNNVGSSSQSLTLVVN